MKEYPKTENLFARSEETKKLVPQLRLPQFGQVDRWLVTEKIDGTNIRLRLRWESGAPLDADYYYVFDGIAYTAIAEVLGRTDNANLPGKGNAFIEQAFRIDDARAFTPVLLDVLRELGDGQITQPYDLCLYGEGYGPGIQKGGGDYADQMQFALFDVVTTAPDTRRELWRPWSEVEQVAEYLDLRTVPYLGTNWSLEQCVEHVLDDTYYSDLAFWGTGTKEREPEGIVARTDPYLYDFRGHRVMFKLKGKDLAHDWAAFSDFAFHAHTR